MTPELRDLISAHRDGIRSHLFPESTCITTEKERPSPDWQLDVAAAVDFVLLLSPDDLPAAPFEFEPGRTIVDREKFLRSIQDDVRMGQHGPRAVAGVLHQDLLAIRSLVVSAMLRPSINTTCISAQ